MMVAGDFNLNLLNYRKYHYISEFINSMLELGLYCTVNIPTKYNHNNEITKFSILDQFWTSMPSDVRVCYILPIDITDHFAVVNSFNLNHKKVQRAISQRTVSHANNIRFTRDLSTILPSSVNDDLNSTSDNYFNNVFDIYDRSYPLVTIKEILLGQIIGLGFALRKSLSYIVCIYEVLLLEMNMLITVIG